MADMNSAGVGQAIGWNAGAEFVCMEGGGPGHLIGYGYSPYSMANASNTYHGTPIVDADGKDVPWIDVFGRELKTVDDRFLPQEGQQFQLGIGIGISRTDKEFRLNDINPDLPERLLEGHDLSLVHDRTLKSITRDTQRRHIARVLRETEGDKKQAAKLLEISVPSLYRKIDKLHLKDA